MKICSFHTCLPGSSGPLVLLKCLLELASFRIKSWGKQLGKKYLCYPLNMSREGKEAFMCSTAKLGLQLKDWIWEKRGIGEDVQLAYLFPMETPKQ